MNKEEIIKEAQEQVNYCTPMHVKDFVLGYIKGAEPREKRIEELEKENAELKADNDARKFAMAMSEKVEKKLREENAFYEKACYNCGNKKLHNLQINPRDLPPESGDMPKDIKPVLAYTKELGWTTAIRRKHNRKYEWYCSNYYGNTVFFDKEIIMWAELPEV